MDRGTQLNLRDMRQRFTILLFLLLGCAIGLHAQKAELGALRGRVLNEKGEALLGATVYILEDSTSRQVISHGTPNAQGEFTLEGKMADSVLFGVSHLGYAPYERVVAGAQAGVDLGEIRLAPQTVEVQSVMVPGRFVRVRQQPNGYSVDVRGLRSESNSGLDLLRQIPNVIVRNEAVKVLGKEKVLLKLGKVLQRVNSDELATALKGIDPSMIKRVEVLMQPPLRYDPEGNAAMVILHTSSFFEQYVGGRVGTEIIYGSHHQRYGGYSTVMMNRGRLFLSATPYGNYNSDASEEESIYTYPDRTYRNYSPSKGHWTVYGGRMTAQYDMHPVAI